MLAAGYFLYDIVGRPQPTANLFLVPLEYVVMVYALFGGLVFYFETNSFRCNAFVVGALAAWQLLDLEGSYYTLVGSILFLAIPYL